MISFTRSTLAAALFLASISVHRVFAETPESLKAHRTAITSVSFSDDSKMLASVSRDGVIILWDLEKRAVRRTFTPARDGKFLPQQIALIPDGDSFVVAGKAGGIQLWDLKTSQSQKSIDAEFSEHFSLAVSSNGKYVAWDEGTFGGIKLWQPRFDKLETIKLQSRGPGGFVGFSPNGSQLLTTIEPSAFALWDVASAKQLITKPGRPPNELKVRAAFSYNGRMIAQPQGFNSRKQSSIAVWDARSGETITELASDSSLLISHVAFLSTDNALVSAAASTALTVWNIEKRTVETTLGSEPEVRADSLARYSAVAALEVSPDGKLVATSSSDNADPVIRLWDVSKFQLTVEKKPPPPVASTDDRPEFRTWTSADGKFETDAILVKIDEGSVTILTREGKAISVRLDQLSKADREYVNQRAKSESQ